MKLGRIFSLLAILFFLNHNAPVAAAPPEVTRFTLSNGIRVTSLYVEDSENLSIFSYLPLGLATDGKAKTQWSHLLEHLIMRTTGEIDYKISNAETMANGIHLDFYGTIDTWREGLELHAKWLSGLPFSAESLAEEVPRALSEITHTETRLATHKWAFAGWNQVFRHGATDVKMRSILSAQLDELQEYRELYMSPSPRLLLCTIGGIKADALQPAMEAQFGHIILNADALPSATVSPGAEKELIATWDVNVLHYMETYAIPTSGHEDYAALYVANLLLNQALMMDAQLKQSIGFIFSNLEPITPEETYLYISASLKPGVDIEKIKLQIAKHLTQLKTANPQVTMLATTLSREIAAPPDITMVMPYKPIHMTEAMMLANIGLQWGLLEFQYGETLQELAKTFSKVSPADVVDVVNRYLSEEHRMRLVLTPREPD